MPKTRTQAKTITRSPSHDTCCSGASHALLPATPGRDAAPDSNPCTPQAAALTLSSPRLAAQQPQKQQRYQQPRRVPAAATVAEPSFAAPAASTAAPFVAPLAGDRRAFIMYAAAAIDARTAPAPAGASLTAVDRIPTLVYLDRISQLTGMEAGAFLAALVLLERVFLKHPALRLTALNAKRLVVATTLVASKLWSDEPCANALWARFSGTFSLADVNAMEAELCEVLSFDLAVEEEHFAELQARARAQAA
jgi:hypothetical protein